jgi:hypothetical protein
LPTHRRASFWPLRFTLNRDERYAIRFGMFPAKPVKAAVAAGLDELNLCAALADNGLGIMRACLETQKLEQLEARTVPVLVAVHCPA